MTKKKSLAWLNCSEEQLQHHVQDWLKQDAVASALKNTIIFLEGKMGAGKSTFARALLTSLVPEFSSRGSPTFPLVQEYQSSSGTKIYHIDLYRLKVESELDDSGILQQIEEPHALAMVEWASMFPEAFSYWKSTDIRPKSVINVVIENGDEPHLRNYFLSY